LVENNCSENAKQKLVNNEKFQDKNSKNFKVQSSSQRKTPVHHSNKNPNAN